MIEMSLELDGIPSPCESLPTLAHEERSPPDARLNAAERQLLRVVRCGADAWHRARNAALITLLVDHVAPPELWLRLPRDAACAERGELCVGQLRVTLGRDGGARLREWLAVRGEPGGGTRGWGEARVSWLFPRSDGRPLEAAELDRMLASVGERCGIAGLNSWRCQRLRFDELRADIIDALARRGGLRPMLPAFAGLQLRETVATALSWVGRGEDTFIPYTYEVDGVGYAFVYPTPHDELHRAFGHHPAEWYDDLVRGVTFRVGHDPDDPAQHRVFDPRFQRLEGRAVFVGTASRHVRGPDDVEWG